MKKKTFGVAAAFAIVLAGAGATAAVQAGLFSYRAPEAAKVLAPVKPKSTLTKQTSYAKDETTEVLVDAPQVASDEIVKVIKHGDHWHVFTKDGREIITYTDPAKAGRASELSSTANVVSARELERMDGTRVVRILKHGDHYHIFTADGREFITYSNPSALYPHLSIGTYTGNHSSGGSVVHNAGYTPGGAGGVSAGTPAGAQGVPGASILPGLDVVEVVNNSSLSNLAIVKILRHEDHWHLYTADGKETVTYTDPSALYSHIKIEEYEGTHNFAPLDDGELFRYEDVAPALLVPLENITYGNVLYSTSFDTVRQRFIIPHLDHFHYVDIETIIQFCKDGSTSFGSTNPRAVVATLKYVLLHPEVRPYKEGWGNDASVVAPTNPDTGVSPDEGTTAGSEAEPSPEPERHAVRIVHEDGRWLVYMSDGSTRLHSKNPAASYPGIEIEESDGFENTEDEDELIERWSAAYGMTTDAFEDALLELPAVSISRIRFQANGTVIIHGVTYNFKTGKRVDNAPSAEATEPANGAEAGDVVRVHGSADGDAGNPAPEAGSGPASEEVRGSENVAAASAAEAPQGAGNAAVDAPKPSVTPAPVGAPVSAASAPSESAPSNAVTPQPAVAEPDEAVA
ncbi:hypothetical protein KPC83_05730 [Collinsella sp. zg1085]|uniref:hypothetical protein n=1 Tax=Collinsella sp. zg1085 TaxID=2844380 RepID=UPI001C0B3746|nr:hypothetical protein [Collinsella sp. zg1085]QWT17340.1 hypothetical protein KPC83_05730 [Collinsella sp. zg1085]